MNWQNTPGGSEGNHWASALERKVTAHMIKTKLKSRRGASITFALMLFVVCAMASAVVIVAATAASGRVSQVAENDQRYYAVNSAAELLRSIIENQSVSVVKETEDGADPSYTYFRGDVSDTALSASYEATPKNLLSVAAKTVTNWAAETDKGEKQYKLQPTGTWLDDTDDNAKALEALEVDIYENIAENGTLTFYISKSFTQKGVSLEYTLRMIFEAEKKENTVTHTRYEAMKMDESGNPVTGEAISTTTTTVYTWHLTDVSKQSHSST